MSGLPARMVSSAFMSSGGGVLCAGGSPMSDGSALGTLIGIAILFLLILLWLGVGELISIGKVLLRLLSSRAQL